MKECAIIVAIDQQGGIGKDGDLPWKLAADMAHFRVLTSGDGNNAVIMGRKTWDSLPARFRPLPGRHNIVISRQTDYPLPDGVELAGSLEQALELAAKSSGDVFVIGGGAIYQAALNHSACRCVHMTAVHATFDCDTFFLPNESEWELVEDEAVQSENGLEFSFCRYLRRS